MKIGRTLPPAASPIPLMDILRALPACFQSVDDCPSEFVREIKYEFDINYCFLVSSGKAALTLILEALKRIYPERDEVLIPAYTCYSVPAAIKRAGLNIRLCDLAPASLDFDLPQLKAIIESDKNEKRILCVLVTHLFGCPADFSAIKAVLGSEIPIVEDAAQAMGEEVNGKKLGTFGDAGFYSLGRGKALSTMEGGVIVTDNDTLADVLKSLISSLPCYSRFENMKLFIKALLTTLLQHPSLFWLPKALPFLRLGETIYEPDFVMRKMSCLQMKLAENWQARLERHRKARLKNIRFLQKKLPSFLTGLCGKKKYALIRLPILTENINQRDKILSASEESGLGITSMYPTTVNKIPQITSEFSGREYPNAQHICARILTFPVHELVSEKDNESINKMLWHIGSV